MIRHYRIDRVNGMEILVCEVYDRYFFSPEEYKAFEAWREATLDSSDVRPSQSDFRVLVNEWCNQEHGPGESFYGLTEPIPNISPIPCVCLRGYIVNGVIASVQADRSAAIPNLTFEDEFSKFVRFVSLPHWRNAVSHQFEQYGTLFTSDNGS